MNIVQRTAVLIVMVLFGCSSDRTGQKGSTPDDSNKPVDTNEGFVSLFDGTSFKGWEGNLEIFRIQDGIIMGGWLDKDIPHNEFLCTEISYENFELRLKAKMVGDDENDILNAGIQFRSKRIPNHHEVIGYQCDMGEDPSGVIWGYLYDESRRRKFLATPDSTSMMAVYKPNGWNDFVIRAEGSRIQIWLNGFQTVDYLEPDSTIDKSGIICLQIHGGAPAEAWYKDIEIRTW